MLDFSEKKELPTGTAVEFSSHLIIDNYKKSWSVSADISGKICCL